MSTCTTAESKGNCQYTIRLWRSWYKEYADRMGEDRLHKCVIAVYEKFHSLEFDKPTSLSYFKAKDVELLKNILDMFQEESIDQKDQLLFLRNSSTIMKIKPKEKGVLII